MSWLLLIVGDSFVQYFSIFWILSPVVEDNNVGPYYFPSNKPDLYGSVKILPKKIICDSFPIQAQGTISYFMLKLNEARTSECN